MNTQDPVKLPATNWDRWLPRIAIAMALVFFAALVTRSRTLIVAAGFLDVLVILGLLGIGTYGLLKRYSTPKDKS